MRRGNCRDLAADAVEVMTIIRDNAGKAEQSNLDAAVQNTTKYAKCQVQNVVSDIPPGPSKQSRQTSTIGVSSVFGEASVLAALLPEQLLTDL